MYCTTLVLVFEAAKMFEVKKLYQSLNIIGTISLAMTVPIIVFRVFRAVCLKKSYNALMGKVTLIPQQFTVKPHC